MSHASAVIPFRNEGNKAKLVECFDPDRNKIDRRLLYEITGLRMRQDELTEVVSELSENSDSDDEIDKQGI